MAVLKVRSVRTFWEVAAWGVIHVDLAPVLIKAIKPQFNWGSKCATIGALFRKFYQSAPQLVHKGALNYLVFDYLSEITMSLLTAAKMKSPDMGYAPDFVHVAIGPLIKDIKNKGIKVISNAGGINPNGCAAALKDVAKQAGIDDLNIAVVTGDDLMPHKADLKKEGVVDIDTGTHFPKTIHSLNAYLGAGPICRALELGADIVITGRCADSSLVLAPLVHEYNWSWDSLDQLAAGSLAGHLIECGAQVTGGIFTDWHSVPDWHNIGFPIVEVEHSGNFIVTKPPGTGGLVNEATVAEQLVYEIGDPENYVLPDVVCDFSEAKLSTVTDREADAVKVTGVKGKQATSTYKICGTYAVGYRSTTVSIIGGPKAEEKGRRTAEAILKRSRNIFKALGISDFSRVNLQILGSEQTYGLHSNKNLNSREAVLWLAVEHSDKKALEIFGREIAPAGTGMAPGLTGLVGGRPRPSPVLKLFSFLYPKDKFEVNIYLNGELREKYQQPSGPKTDCLTNRVSPNFDSTVLPTGSHSYRLEDLAYTRSGDKGNSVNIGVIARHPSYVPYLKAFLTVEAVEEYLSHLFEDRNGPLESRISRYELPGIQGFNFLLRNALGGGGVASLRSDPQGKAVGQMILDMKITNVPDLISSTRK